MTTIHFEFTWSKVWVKLLGFEKMLSAKYLLTPLLENRQTWYSSGSLRVDISYWCSGERHTVALNLSVVYESSYQSRSDCQLQTMEMQHLKNRRLFFHQDKTLYGIQFIEPLIWKFYCIYATLFIFARGGGHLCFSVIFLFWKL